MNISEQIIILDDGVNIFGTITKLNSIKNIFIFQYLTKYCLKKIII